jgi:hypothetical protein
MSATVARTYCVVLQPDPEGGHVAVILHIGS